MKEPKPKNPLKGKMATHPSTVNNLVSEVEGWIGESKIFNEKSDSVVWNYLLVLNEMRNMIHSPNGKKIFENVFEEQPPLNKKPPPNISNSEKELIMVAQIKTQILRNFTDISLNPKDSNIIKLLENLRGTIELLLGDKKPTKNPFQQTPVSKQSTFFQTVPGVATFGSFHEDLKKIASYLDEKIEVLNAQRMTHKK